MKDLKVTLIQSKIKWEAIESNLAAFGNHISQISTPTDLIVLPEMFATGFTMNTVENAQSMNGSIVQWMLKMAVEKSTTVIGSVIIKDKGQTFNRLIVANQKGEVNYYDKRHLFRMAGEHNYYAGGTDKKVIEIKGWKLNLLVCYDLRFPVWSRNEYTQVGGNLEAKYDLLLYVANWPAIRANAWNTLLAARAIENQCYTLGVNRVGSDGNNVDYSGNSKVIDPKGSTLFKLDDNQEGIISATLSYTDLKEFREKFPVGLDAD